MRHDDYNMGDAYDIEASDVEEEAGEVAKLLKGSLKTKDSLLKALKVGNTLVIGPWTRPVAYPAAPGYIFHFLWTLMIPLLRFEARLLLAAFPNSH